MIAQAAIIQEIRARRHLAQTLGRRVRRTLPRVPRQLPPGGVQLGYYRALRAIVDRAAELVRARLVPRLASMLPRADGERARADAPADELGRALRGIEDTLFETYGERRLREVAAEAGHRASKHNKEQVQRQVKTVLGVDVVAAEPWLQPAIDAFVAENVDLIKSVPQRLFGEIRELVTEGALGGQRHEQIAQQMEERLGVARSRAKLIARDQILKFSGDLNEKRQQGLGVTHYIWRTVGDNRVRAEHARLNGERFAWSKPPAEGHPGHAVQCRCSAEPDLSDIFGGATAERGTP